MTVIPDLIRNPAGVSWPVSCNVPDYNIAKIFRIKEVRDGESRGSFIWLRGIRWR